MANKYELEVTTRKELGKGASRRMRRIEEVIPGVVYGAGQEATSITILHKTNSKALENEGFYSHILTLKIDGKAEKVVIKALQRHPYKPRIMHADFLRVSATEKLTMHIPLHIVGEESCPGVKLQQGVISRMFTDVEIRCLPADLPEYLELDISKAELDSLFHLSDLKLPKGVEITALAAETPHDQPILSIHLPHIAQEPEEGAAAEEAEAAEEPGEGEEAKGGEAKEE